MDEDWQNKLALDRRGNIKDTLQNIALIIRNDENFKHIVYNEFKDTIDVIGPLPWKQVKPGWNDSDLANAKVYFERVYGIWSPTKFKDALLAVVSSDRLYHPIKDYLQRFTGTDRSVSIHCSSIISVRKIHRTQGLSSARHWWLR